MHLQPRNTRNPQSSNKIYRMYNRKKYFTLNSNSYRLYMCVRLSKTKKKRVRVYVRQGNTCETYKTFQKMWLRIEGLSGNSGVMIKETFCTVRCTQSLPHGQRDWTFELMEVSYKKGFLCRDKNWEKQAFLKKKKLERNGICLSGAVRLTALCCVRHPNYDVQLDSDVNIMAFICVVYASIQRYCSRILTYL